MANRLSTGSTRHLETAYQQLGFPPNNSWTGGSQDSRIQERTVVLSDNGMTVRMTTMPSASIMDCRIQPLLATASCSPKTRGKQLPKAANNEMTKEPRYYKTKLCKYTATGGCPRGARFMHGLLHLFHVRFMFQHSYKHSFMFEHSDKHIKRKRGPCMQKLIDERDGILQVLVCSWRGRTPS
jgi:hypothetical protein